MSSKIGLKLTRNYSFNFSLLKRNKDSIKFIIIHYTGMKKQSEAIKRLTDSESKVSSHYFIKNEGKILKLVPDLYEAWHAGKSGWKNFKSLNKYSIGIEINNPGHDHNYKRFNKKQILSLVKLIGYLKNKYAIKKDNILGHSDISPDRKKDPGEKFPWRELAKKNLCTWHDLNDKNLKKFRKLKLKDEKIFFKNLFNLGYSKIYKNSKKDLILAFQRRFRQDLINGKTDEECLLISQNLLKS